MEPEVEAGAPGLKSGSWDDFDRGLKPPSTPEGRGEDVPGRGEPIAGWDAAEPAGEEVISDTTEVEVAVGTLRERSVSSRFLGYRALLSFFYNEV